LRFEKRVAVDARGEVIEREVLFLPNAIVRHG
jgi:hypothetical protein